MKNSVVKYQRKPGMFEEQQIINKAKLQRHLSKAALLLIADIEVEIAHDLPKYEKYIKSKYLKECDKDLLHLNKIKLEHNRIVNVIGAHSNEYDTNKKVKKVLKELEKCKYLKQIHKNTYIINPSFFYIGPVLWDCIVLWSEVNNIEIPIELEEEIKKVKDYKTYWSTSEKVYNELVEIGGADALS